MKSIFENKKAIGFDFDNTLVHIDSLHKQSWLLLAKELQLNITSKELFIWQVSKYTRFDNFSNIYNCFTQNPNINLDVGELTRRLKKLLQENNIEEISINKDWDIAVALYYLKEKFLTDIINSLSNEKLQQYLYPECIDFITALKDSFPQVSLFIASSTSSLSVQTFLNKSKISNYFDLVIGEDNMRIDANNPWSLRDKPSEHASHTVLEVLHDKLGKDLKPSEVLYIGDDAIRDYEFAKNVDIQYIQVEKYPKLKEDFSFYYSFSDLTENLTYPLVKVCRVKDIHTARYLARNKVDFLGLHVIFDLPEIPQLNQYKMIIEELAKYYPHTKTVLVTRSEDEKKVAEFAFIINTDFIQFHSKVTKEQKLEVLDNLVRNGISAIPLNVISSSEFTNDSLFSIIGDYVLIDQDFHGGTGQEVNKKMVDEIISSLKEKHIFLAGGINAENVIEKTHKFAINVIDIQSSLERENDSEKRKDIHKVKEFITTLYPQRSMLLIADKQLISLSLQEQVLTDQIVDVTNTNIDILHADFSDGVLVSGWEVDCTKAIKYWADTNPFIPLDIHLYSSSLDTIVERTNSYKKIHPQIRAVFIHIQNEQCIERMELLLRTKMDLILGISINYNLEDSLYDKVITLVNKSPEISELLICLPNKEKDTWKFDVETVLLMQKLKSLKEDRQLRIGIDRDVIPHRISFATRFDVTHFVIGKYIYQSKNTQQAINYLRNTYEQTRSSNH